MDEEGMFIFLGLFLIHFTYWCLKIIFLPIYNQRNVRLLNATHDSADEGMGKSGQMAMWANIGFD